MLWRASNSATDDVPARHAPYRCLGPVDPPQSPSLFAENPPRVVSLSRRWRVDRAMRGKLSTSAVSHGAVEG
jgi:hypothetical protein